MPISEEAIWDEINAAWDRMNTRQRRFWEAVRIAPEKWTQIPWGDLGGGFWAVAVIGSVVVWYNDIEDGFNRSEYECHGTIGAYWCNQDELEMTVQQLLDIIDTGYDIGARLGPPRPGPLPVA